MMNDIYTFDKGPTLEDVMPDFFESSGIFEHLIDLECVAEIDPDILNMTYLSNVSGTKQVSRIVRKMVDQNADGKLSESQILKLANMVRKLYSQNWEKLFVGYHLAYEPIENYLMTESGSDITTSTGTVKDTGTVDMSKGTIIDAVDTTVNKTDYLSTNTITSSSTEDNQIDAFDSSTSDPFNPVTKNVIGSNDTNAKTGNDTITNSGGIKTTSNGSDVNTSDLTKTNNLTDETIHTFKRSGNIGVTTSQQMLESEFKLWMNNYMYDVIYADLDKLLTCGCY